MFSLQFGTAQIDYDTYKSSSQKTLLTDLLLVKRADQKPQKTSILIENGKIKAISTNIKAPYDAKVIKLDSMFVYPGFIAGLSHVGISKEEEKALEKPKFPGAPSNSRAGIKPELSSIDLFDGSDATVEKFRSNGFTIAHAVPHGRMITGTGAAFSLSGKSNEFAVVKNKAGIYSQFKGADGVYPRTSIAILAKWRDLYNNARYATDYIPSYEKDPVNNQRPQYDKSVTALAPIVKKQMPLFFKTSNAKEVYRVLELQKELGFDVCLSELSQSWLAMDALKNSSATILLSTKLPKKLEEEDKDDELNDEETKSLKEKKKWVYDKYLKEAGELSKNNISFGFSFIESKTSDLQSNIIRMIENGLSPQVALEALTINPAKILQIDKVCGSIDIGKLANLVVTDKSYFEEDAKIKYVVVEGEVFDYNKKSDGKNEIESDLLLNGEWNYEVDMFGNTQRGKTEIRMADEIVTVTLIPSDLDEKSEAKNIKIKGTNMTFDFTIKSDAGPLELAADIDFDPETEDYSGTITAEFGSFPIKGSKISPKN